MDNKEFALLGASEMWDLWERLKRRLRSSPGAFAQVRGVPVKVLKSGQGFLGEPVDARRVSSEGLPK